MKVHSFSYYLHRTSLCVAVSPPDGGPFEKTVQITIFGLETINLDQSLCLMAFWVQEGKIQYLESFLYILTSYFIVI